MNIKNEFDLKLLITAYLGFIIIIMSLFLPWIKIYGTLPPPPNGNATQIEHSIFDNGVIGWNILFRNQEGGGERVSIGAWFSLILLLALTFLLPTIFYGNWKWLLYTGIISIIFIVIILAFAVPVATANVARYPLIGIIMAFVGGIITVGCSQILKRLKHLSPPRAGRGAQTYPGPAERRKARGEEKMPCSEVQGGRWARGVATAESKR